ncbi:MAG TPA: 50S ribosomal protein L22 [Mesotoga sp.]|uniref:50S ribosomal protein L22 n=1 Tax=unclassified Mesotoga TaxID=1184398 RepID=UPI000CBCE336|nr:MULTISPECIES: 50S ribosomal protein L22 [unclassified Mesotoga]PNQ05964.1 50S ribosomal protein L22 [Mesotoga sp. SC_NapDC3]PXF35210.1 50S ribosomal protein L22 [Mesotoga sp. SC_NapDC]RAM61471.1 50S ribosomal protein L22 [Mesotoga sp. SC_3PWM13N19]RIZ61396.1 50S ribosomal protein L22 [Mesotoga sp. SC_NapDC2]HNU23961.1 50S ribosomal protein L22 [Mesotoga sp.]
MAQATQRDKRSVFHRKRKEAAAATPVTQAKAVAKFVRISPRKARSVVNAIRNKEVGEAFQILEFSPKKASRLVYKVLRSAVANAENNFGLNIDSLYVEKAVVDDGPRMKRLWPRGRGRADIQQKRFSHITVVVANREETSNPQE